MKKNFVLLGLIAAVIMIKSNAASAQTAFSAPGANGAVLSWIESSNADAERQLRQVAGSATHDGALVVLNQLNQLEQDRAQVRIDLEQVFLRFMPGGEEFSLDSSVLLGRYQLEEILLPLRDFLEASNRGYKAYGSSRPLPNPSPGRYSEMELKELQAALETIAAIRYRECLIELEQRLAGSLPQQVLIAPAALNVLYTGVENPLRVFGGQADPESLELRGPGIRFDQESGLWMVKPDKPGPLVIQLVGKAPNGQNVSGEANFEARRVPDPVIVIGGRSDGIIKKNEVVGLSGIAARNDDFLFDAGYTVKGFEMVYTPEYGSPVSAKTSGNKFTEDMLGILKRTRSGDRLLFRVAVELPDGLIKTLSPTFYVR